MTRAERKEQLAAFIRIWQAATCLDEVTAALGIDRRDASNTAAYLRRGTARNPGIPLQAFVEAGIARGSQRMTMEDWNDLRRVAEIEASARETRKYRETA